MRVFTPKIVVLCVGACLALPISATAAPFQGQGQGASEARRSPRRAALNQAKLAALKGAIEEVGVRVDPGAAKEVIDRYLSWTGAYRVMRESRGDGLVSLELEVDIDLPRLRKRLAVASEGSTLRTLRLDDVVTEGACRGGEADSIVDVLRAAGIVGAAGDRVALHVSCAPLGQVTVVRSFGAQVEASLGGGSVGRVEARARAFAETEEAALGVASARVAAELTEEISRGLSRRVTLRLENPWPATHVRKIVTRLREAVLGVRDARISGIERDGIVRVEVTGDLDASKLAARLAGLTFTGFSLTPSRIRIDSPHVLTIQIQ